MCANTPLPGDTRYNVYMLVCSFDTLLLLLKFTIIDVAQRDNISFVNILLPWLHTEHQD